MKWDIRFWTTTLNSDYLGRIRVTWAEHRQCAFAKLSDCFFFCTSSRFRGSSFSTCKMTCCCWPTVCVWVRLTQRIIRVFFRFTLLLLLLSTTSLSAPHVVVPFGLETRSTQRVRGHETSLTVAFLGEGAERRWVRQAVMGVLRWRDSPGARTSIGQSGQRPAEVKLFWVDFYRFHIIRKLLLNVCLILLI